MTTPRTRIVIVEDETLSASVLSKAMSCDADIELVGVAASERDGITLCRSARPDVAVVDWLLGDGNGVSLIDGLAHEIPQIRWLVMSAYNYSDLVHAATHAGAHGVVDKTCVGLPELRRAILALASDNEYFCPISSRYLRSVVDAISPPLTDREKRILALLSRCMTRRRIGEIEGLSAATISEHVCRLAVKLGVGACPSSDVIVSAARAAGRLPRLPDGLVAMG